MFDRIEYENNSVLFLKKISKDETTQMRLEFLSEGVFSADFKPAVQEIAAQNIASALNKFVHEHKRFPKSEEVPEIVIASHRKTKHDLDRLVLAALHKETNKWFCSFEYVSHAVNRAHSILEYDIREDAGKEPAPEPETKEGGE